MFRSSFFILFMLNSTHLDVFQPIKRMPYKIFYPALFSSFCNLASYLLARVRQTFVATFPICFSYLSIDMTTCGKECCLMGV